MLKFAFPSSDKLLHQMHLLLFSDNETRLSFGLLWNMMEISKMLSVTAGIYGIDGRYGIYGIICGLSTENILKYTENVRNIQKMYGKYIKWARSIK